VLTWDDLKKHLLADANGAAAGPTEVRVMARQQGVQVVRTEAFGFEAFVLVAPLFGEARLGWRAALEHGASLPVGAFVLQGGEYVLRAVFPSLHATLPQVRDGIEALAREAARLRVTFAQKTCGDMFSGYES